MASILRQTTVVRDGFHNGFTDLLFWQDCYWVGYRKGSGHASIDGQACVSVSTDRVRFREAARLKMPGDCRDPKLVPMGEDKLALIFPSWKGGSTEKNLQQYVSFSKDGYVWETPVPILDPHWWLWRVVPYEGRYYGACYTYRDRSQLSLAADDAVTTGPLKMSLDFLVSDDLIHWDVLSEVPGDQPNEAGFCFRTGGEVWMVARGSKASRQAQFCCSRSPYKEWEVISLPVDIHAPITLEHEGKIYVAGRRNVEAEEETTYPFARGAFGGGPYSLGVWELEYGSVKPLLRIPASGDCSYPGLVHDKEGRVCLSYYSQHAYTMGVVNPPVLQYPPSLQNAIKIDVPCDVYFAELSLP